MADPLGGYVPYTVKNDEPIREPIARLGKNDFRQNGSYAWQRKNYKRVT